MTLSHSRGGYPEPTIVTRSHAGRWINTIVGTGSLPGSFRSRDAAVAVGRAYAVKAKIAHVIESRNGEIAETRSYAGRSEPTPLPARDDEPTREGAGADEPGTPPPADELSVATDPATAERVRQHERFEWAMAEKGLLQDDHGVRTEPEAVRHEEPAGTEQSAG